jgi:hypothetical protein
MSIKTQIYGYFMRLAKDKLQQFLKTCLVVFGVIAVCGTVSGCHPCSVIQCPGEVKPTLVPAITRVEARIGNDGSLYIDVIGDRDNLARFDSISILKTNSNNDSEVYWDIKANDKKTDNYKFPVKYGEDAGVKTITSPKIIINGIYIIKGEAVFFSKEGVYRRFINGKFSYENGVTKNFDY